MFHFEFVWTREELQCVPAVKQGSTELKQHEILIVNVSSSLCQLDEWKIIQGILCYVLHLEIMMFHTFGYLLYFLLSSLQLLL